MRKNGIVKACISMILIFTVVFCSSFSVFAYNPVISILSSDWDVAADGTFKAVYPDSVPPLTGLSDKVFKHSVYNGNTYFTSNYWDDDYEKLQSTDFYFPSFPNSDYGDHIVIRIHDTYYLIQDFPDYIKFYTDGNSLYYYTGLEEVFYIYRLSYPFSEWVLNSSVLAFDTLQYVKIDLPVYDNEFEIIYSDVKIYDYNDKNVAVYAPDAYVLQSQKQTIEYYAPMSVLVGKMSYALTGDALKKLLKGEYVVNWNKQGYIVGTNTDYIYYDLSASLYQNGKLLNSFPMIQQSIYDSEEVLGAGEASLPYTYMEIIELEDDFPSDGVMIIFNFVFVSTGCNLFFPGDIEFIRFDDFEDEQKHNEITGSLNTISGTLNDLNDNMPSAIKQELEPLYNEIKQEINNGTLEIVDSVDNASKSITEKLVDLKDNITEKLTDLKDGVTEKLDDVKNGLLEGIKNFFIPSDEAMEEIDNKWDELLKSRFGALYEVADIITDFASQMSWDYIKQAGEKNTITMPSVTVKLVDTNFTFGGYEVSIVPDGFDVLTTALKGITSIVCTLMFVNALRRKYDKLVGGAAA